MNQDKDLNKYGYNMDKVKNEPICLNCYYWKRQNKDQGSCELSKQRPLYNKIMYSSCGLKTHKDFGCNQFTNKQNKE